LFGNIVEIILGFQGHFKLGLMLSPSASAAASAGYSYDGPRAYPLLCCVSFSLQQSLQLHDAAQILSLAGISTHDFVRFSNVATSPSCVSSLCPTDVIELCVSLLPIATEPLRL